MRAGKITLPCAEAPAGRAAVSAPATTRLVWLFFIGVFLLAGCQNPVRESPATGGPATIVPKFRGKVISVPPRSIDDLRTVLGPRRPIPPQCAGRYSQLRETIHKSETSFETHLSLISASGPYWVGEGRARQGFRPDTTANIAVNLLNRAKQAFEIGDYRNSIDVLVRVQDRLAQDLDSRDTRIARTNLSASLAWMASSKGDLEVARNARDEVERALRFADDFVLGYTTDQRSLAIASVALLEGRLEIAEKEFRIAAGTGPQQRWIGALLARTLIARGRLLEAEAQARRAVVKSMEFYDTSPRDARIGITVTVLAEALLEQRRYREALHIAEMAVNLQLAQCTLPESLWLADARNAAIQARAGLEDWDGIVDELDSARMGLADQPGAFERLYGQLPEAGLALVETGAITEGLSLLDSAYQLAVQRHGEQSARAIDVGGIRAWAQARAGDTGAAASQFVSTARKYLREPEPGAGSAPELRGERSRRTLEAYLEFLATAPETDALLASDGDVASAAFRAAQLIRDSRVQRALGGSNARAAASAEDPELAVLARQEQDAGEAERILLELLHFASMASNEQFEPDKVSWLLTRIDDLRAIRGQIRASIERRFPRYARLVAPRPLSLAEARNLLKPGESLLVFHVGNRFTLGWATAANGPGSFTVIEHGEKALRARVTRLRGALEPEGIATIDEIPTFDLNEALDLFRDLLLPLEQGWRDSTHLLVVADGALGELPFAVLATKKPVALQETALAFTGYRNVAWLARSHAVSMLPTAGSLRSLARVGEQARPGRPLIGFGDPLFAPRARSRSMSASRGAGFLALRDTPTTRTAATATLADLPPLPETAKELRVIAEALGANPDTHVHLRERASEETVKASNLAEARVIAFATHGLLPHDLDGLTQPALALSSPAVTGGQEDGLLTTNEILELRLDADWVVLSACNTAAADGAGAEAISGLGRAFFHAGARALLVSQWPVHSHATADLTVHTFRQGASVAGLPRSEALRRAMVWMIDHGAFVSADGTPMFSYAHPIFWAPFIVVGDGRGA